MLHTVSLKENHVFRRLYHRGNSAANRYLVFYCRPNGSKQSRLGFTVSTKLGHAVVRNRVRRRLREIYRLHEAEFCRASTWSSWREARRSTRNSPRWSRRFCSLRGVCP